MGTPVPDEWPEIEDDKWYAVDCTNYGIVPPLYGCDGPVVGDDHCCRRGFAINDWYDTESECKLLPVNICGPLIGDTSLITCIIGPYDTEEECEAA